MASLFRISHTLNIYFVYTRNGGVLIIHTQHKNIRSPVLQILRETKHIKGYLYIVRKRGSSGEKYRVILAFGKF